MKFVVVTGGVVSGLGKGVTISSTGRLLQSAGLRVTAIKIDPYLNVDAGTMSPFEHGEVFVLRDGGEGDLDLGNYERFLGLTLTSDHNVTTGKIYRKVILAERRGDYLGKTVQVVPHITDAVQEWIERVAAVPVDGSGSPADVCLIEVGGTVGDIESSVFLEALRQFQFRVGPSNFCLCFVSLVPVLSEEQKTKPTQHGVRDLRSLGLSPAVIFCRSTQPLQSHVKAKISSFCHVPVDNVLSVHDVSNVYLVPTLLREQNLHGILRQQLQLTETLSPDLKSWEAMAAEIDSADKTVTIALIGKYTGLQDSYLSVIKALRHASIACRVKLQLEWIEASMLEEGEQEEGNAEGKASPNQEQDDSNNAAGNDKEDEEEEDPRAVAWRKLAAADGVVVPGGFGQRGWEGKIAAARYCRCHKKPYLGVCLGFQAAVVEYSRNVLHWSSADSTEFNESTAHPVVVFMPEIDKTTMGGTMRLGARDTVFVNGTLGEEEQEQENNNKDKDKEPQQEAGGGGGRSCYYSTARLLYGGVAAVSERHRHRYEVNPAVVADIHTAGLLFTGRDVTGDRMEIAELPAEQHPYYVGCQFHPEFTSRPLQPSPPFHGLILAAAGQLHEYLETAKKKKKKQRQQQQQKTGTTGTPAAATAAETTTTTA